VLPLLQFTEVCRKVYFAVEEYSDIESLLANGFLYYIFSEHYITSGIPRYKEYYCMCRLNFLNGLRRLPLFLPATREVVAALTLGVGSRFLREALTRAATDLASRRL
jgi:hypothetical protein